MILCVWCGAKAVVDDIDSGVYWRCKSCGGISMFGNRMFERFYQGAEWLKPTRCPNGCLYVAASEELCWPS